MQAGICKSLLCQTAVTLNPAAKGRLLTVSEVRGSGSGRPQRWSGCRELGQRGERNSFAYHPRQGSGQSLPVRKLVVVRAEGEQKEDDTWRRRSLSSLEEELLGIQPADVKKKQKEKPKEVRDEWEEPTGPKRRANGEEWSMLDEVEEKLGFALPDLDRYPVVQQLTKVGEWLDEKTTVKEEDYGTEPWTGLWVILGLFPIWLFCVLVATGVIHLPPALAPLEAWLTTE